MVQYTYAAFKDGILFQEITNLSLQEAYHIAKPPTMNIYNNRWHIMMFHAVIERIAERPVDEYLMIAWEQEMVGMSSETRYIKRDS